MVRRSIIRTTSITIGCIICALLFVLYYNRLPIIIQTVNASYVDDEGLMYTSPYVYQLYWSYRDVHDETKVIFDHYPDERDFLDIIRLRIEKNDEVWDDNEIEFHYDRIDVKKNN